MATRYNSITIPTLLCDLGAWGKRLQYFAFVINGTSQVVRLAVNLHEHFIQVPLPIGVNARVLDTFFADFFRSKNRPKSVHQNRTVSWRDASKPHFPLKGESF